MRKRKAVSPVIATLLLIAIAVAAAIIVYSFVTGLIGGITSGTSSAGTVTLTADITVPGGSSAAPVIVLSLKNTGQKAITHADLATATTNGGAPTVADMSISPASGATPIGGAAVYTFTWSPATDVPAGGTATATVNSYGTAPVIASGYSYTFSLLITFADGTTTIATASATAHS